MATVVLTVAVPPSVLWMVRTTVWCPFAATVTGLGQAPSRGLPSAVQV